MTRRLWVSLALLAGCIPAVTGAPCETDANCPGGQVCVAGKCAEGVGMGGGSGGGSAGGGGGTTGGGEGGGAGGGTAGGVGGGGGGGAGGGGGLTGGGGGSTGGGGGNMGGGGGATGGGGGATGGGSGASLPQATELISAGGRAQGGTLTLDLQVGHVTPRTKMTGGTLEVTGAAAVQR
ncbi:MAG: EB domain-containing protein [Archangium sp.]|nr:EB domain-containing protein [Archangium sp.]